MPTRIDVDAVAVRVDLYIIDRQIIDSRCENRKMSAV